MSIFVKKAFSRKFQNFLNYRLACFAKNGEKLVFKIWTFFDCYMFILINYCILENAVFLKISREVCNQEKPE
ncbi:hypothetical protein T4D_12803 [Trichinella pseudospiralis]|uniref:Uncharacterized protein n=1 Tax=Trichinella pseudospiralis TaxID=6337 RepID=A0A0V1DSX4_TRIPS|nr:hypothetical protein T4D_12803 [Trichinella pseudospiralis]